MSREVALSEGAGLSVMDEFIARAIEDPKFDADKLTKLYELRQRDLGVNAEIAFNVAFAAAKKEMPHVKKRGIQDMGGKGKITFAKYEDMDAVVTPIEEKHGFVRSFRSRFDSGTLLQVCVLRHKQGHSEVSERPIVPDKGPGRNDVQAIGSGSSYAKRYLTKDLWDIITEDDRDDDGKRAGAITTDQADQLLTLCTKLDWTTPEARQPFLDWLKVRKVADIQKHDYIKAEAELLRRIKVLEGK